MTWHLRVVSSLLLALVLAACTQPAPDTPPVEEPIETVHVRLLAFNDFHGALEGPSGNVLVAGEPVETGGAEYFAAHIAAERSEVEYSFVVAAGDLIGATPLISALFHDEPTIEILTKAGLDISSVGNHEFDAGVDELLRIVEGGCHPEEGCRDDHEYQGAGFTYLAANVRWRDSGEVILPAYEIREVAGLKVAFVGMTLENTPSVVVPSAIEAVSFHDEVETVAGLIDELEEGGVDTVVVLVHEGGRATEEQTDINDCPGVQGPIVSIAEEIHPLVSVIVTGHSHQAHICEFGGRLVTQAGHSGRIITVIDLYLDPETGDVLERTARQRPVSRDIEPVAAVADRVAGYRTIAEPLANRPIGTITADIPRRARAQGGNSPMGRLIADAQLTATADEAGAQIAFMNPGGIRTHLSFTPDDAEEGMVTFNHLHTAQPFGNVLITMTLTGDQIHRLLEQQWEDPDRQHVLAVSEGFSYRYDLEAPPGERVDPASITLHGEVLDPEADYRVTVNNFMADGGDGFTVLTEGTDRTGGVVDLDALATYVEANSPLSPDEEPRFGPVE